MAKTTIGKAEPLLKRLAEDMALELVEVSLAKEAGALYLRICIDKEEGLSLSDCEAFHKRCLPFVEGVEYDFLECSSPGIDRPLKTERDYIKHIGSEVEVRLYRPVDGQKAFTGILGGCADGVVTLKTALGDRQFAIKDAAQVRPVINWDKQFEQMELEGEDGK